MPVIPVGFNFATCTLTSDSMLSEDAAPVGPFIRRPVGYWFSSPGVGNSDTASFENIAAHPDFPRIAVAYDTIPEAVGAVWGNFPASTFNAMAPRGALRNQKGREAAVAYRERGCEPYSYVALSYDERGRVEALVRYTENIDFDAVYYTYNSMNQVTSVRTADYLRQHQTWYGFDANGRIDSVWTALGAVTSGLCDVSGVRYRDPLTRPDSADIVYRYTRTAQVDTMLYPPAGTMVTYDYTHRKWLDSLVAVGPSGSLFREILSHDPTGQIMRQVWQHGTGARTAQAYTHDSTQRLKAWTEGPDGSVPTLTSAYTYDAAGNRLTANVGTTTETYTVTAGMNRLASRTAAIPGTGQRRTDLTYNANGAATVRELTKKVGANSWVLLQRDEFGYSFRDLLKRTVRTIPLSGGGADIEDWRYRYSAGGEREQKRKMPRVIGHEGEVTPWVYYLLGANKAQLAVYHAQEGKNIYCADTNNRAWWYPWEYITNGVGGVAQVLTRPTGAKQYVVSDHLGSARTTVDGSGAVLGATDFRPFGEPIVAGLPSRKSYIDREVDRENNLGNFGVRAYDAGLGRFLSVDPLWEKYRGLGGYQYVNNNPTINLDPSGDTIVVRFAPGSNGNDFFAMRAMNDQLNAFRQKGGEIGAIMKQLDESKNIHEIWIGSNGEATSGPKNWDNASNGVGCGAIIKMDPRFREKMLADISDEHRENASEETNAPWFIALAGELIHASNTDRGVRDDRIWFMLSPKRSVLWEEFNAHRRENLVREQYQIPIRQTYGGRSLYPPPNATGFPYKIGEYPVSDP